MSGIPQPSAEVGVKLASLVAHADEFMSPYGEQVDLDTFKIALADPDVQTYLAALDELALLPLRRNA